MADSYSKHDQDDYAEAMANLLPTGAAWPRDSDSDLMKVVQGLAGPWSDVAAACDQFLMIESDPRQAIVMLPDWEKAFGLPDPCVSPPLTIADRHTALVQRMTMLGAQSRAFFIAVALQIGYTITIQEYSPVMCGISVCGDTRNADGYYRWQIGEPWIRFFWTVHVSALRYTYFRASAGQSGVDHLLEIGLAIDLECMLRRWKPAHTEIIFDYSPVNNIDFSQPFDSGYMIIMGF